MIPEKIDRFESLLKDLKLAELLRQLGRTLRMWLNLRDIFSLPQDDPRFQESLQAIAALALEHGLDLARDEEFIRECLRFRVHRACLAELPSLIEAAEELERQNANTKKGQRGCWRRKPDILSKDVMDMILRFPSLQRFLGERKTLAQGVAQYAGQMEAMLASGVPDRFSFLAIWIICLGGNPFSRGDVRRFGDSCHVIEKTTEHVAAIRKSAERAREYADKLSATLRTTDSVSDYYSAKHRLPEVELHARALEEYLRAL